MRCCSFSRAKERLPVLQQSKNLVFKGLKNSTAGNDTVSDEHYLIILGYVTHARHLGQPGNGVVPPLLVSFWNSKDADLVLSPPNELRNESDEYIRTRIYINADLTPAEAKTAFEERCLRRQRGFATKSTLTFLR